MLFTNYIVLDECTSTAHISQMSLSPKFYYVRSQPFLSNVPATLVKIINVRSYRKLKQTSCMIFARFFSVSKPSETTISHTKLDAVSSAFSRRVPYCHNFFLCAHLLGYPYNCEMRFKFVIHPKYLQIYNYSGPTFSNR